MTSRSWLLELKWSDTSFSVKWIWKVNGIKWNSLHNTRPEQVIYVTDEEVIVNAKETNWSLMDEFLAASEPEMLLNTLHLWIASVFWVECLHCTVLIVSPGDVVIRCQQLVYCEGPGLFIDFYLKFVKLRTGLITRKANWGWSEWMCIFSVISVFLSWRWPDLRSEQNKHKLHL